MSKMDDLNDVAERWAKQVAGAGDRYKKGVMKVQEAPTHTAARMEDKYVRKVQEAVSSGRYRARLMASTLADYQRGCTETGAARLASGATKGKSKLLAHLQQAKPVYDALQSKLAGIPNTDDAAAEQRAVETIRHMRQLKKK